MTQDFGGYLKEWRQIRRMSQMDLAMNAEVSPRHISFLETGRSRPSRGMILRLCDELDVPRSARNQLLAAAGMSAAFKARALDAAEMAPLREAMDWMLSSHAPYPAVALDRHWCLEAMNAPAKLMFGTVGVTQGDSLLNAFLFSDPLRGAIKNLQEMERLSLARLRTELAHFGSDPILEEAISVLQERQEVSQVQEVVMPAMIPAHYQFGDQVLSLISTIAQFGATDDIALAELRIELFFPADEITRLALQALVN